MGVVLVAAGATLLSASTALAQAETGVSASASPSAEDKAGARAAANAGADAFDAGEFQKSADLFLRAEAIIHSPVHELYIARAFEKIGRLVEARELFLKIQRSNESERVVKDAKSELLALEPRVPRVTIELDGAADEELTILIDGRTFRNVLLGVEQPFDPGQHVAVVSLAEQSMNHSFAVEEGKSQSVLIDVTKIVEAAKVARAKEEEEEEKAAAANSSEVPASDSSHSAGSKNKSGLRIGSYVALGLGAVGLGAGAFFSVKTGTHATDANLLCEEIDEREGTQNCAGRTSEEETEIDDIEAQHAGTKTGAIVAFGVGGAALATGVTLLILGSTGSKERLSYQGVRVRPMVGLSYLGLEGRF